MKRFSKEIALGLAGILTIGILYYGISFLKGLNMFTTNNVYYVAFDDINGLSKSSPVYADGYSIGVVSDINYDYKKGGVFVQIDVDKDLRIPAGSTAELEKEMLGTLKLHILLANNPREKVHPGDTIPGTSNNGLLKNVDEIIPKLDNMFTKMDSILVSVNALLSDPSIKSLLGNTEKMTANLAQATAKLNQLLGNDMPKFTHKLDNVLANVDTLTYQLNDKVAQLDVERLMTQVNGTLSNVEMLSKKMTSNDNTIGLLLNDPSLYHNLNTTVTNASSLLDDLQNHPKRYVHFSLFGKKDKKK